MTYLRKEGSWCIYDSQWIISDHLRYSQNSRYRHFDARAADSQKIIAPLLLMLYTAKELDAQFYQMIHEIVESESETNRRNQERESFCSIQRIAPLRGQSMPHANEFFKVRCNDLTTKGFSFFLNNDPDFDNLVIALESSGKTINVHAEVRHHRRILLHPASGRVETLDDCAKCGDYFESEASIPMTMVGCSFTGRVQ